ncbi:MAG: 50S ribosomal protein L21 [Microgenomates group bacterium ADurb.Bin219]|nr:MAG: 50S ribosomal protein L21 [Microgenomates group bacterium ADurb.Bin219]HNP89623.1 50S ribosomal protein L21 [Candidatus Woesebacteria bacterium]
MKYAVVKISNKQYLASEGDTLRVNKLSLEKGKKFVSEEILLLVDGDKVTLGKPLVEGIKMEAEVIGEEKGEKVRVAKFKAKTGYRRVTGFRPQFTLLKINKIA